MVEAADPDANDPRGRDQRDDPNAPVDAGLKAGPPYPQDQVVAVKALQTRLEKLGYSVGSTGIDGKYGPRTARAVAAFKKDNNITATAGSTVTPQELTVLKTAKSVKSPTPTGNTSRAANVPLGDLADTANLPKAKEVVEEYLGSEISDNDMNMLVRAIASEASRHNRERAAVAGVILNRVRTNYGPNGGYGASIPAQLNAKNQFQAVTGTPDNGRRPADGYKNMTTRTAGEVIGTVIQNLSSQNKTWMNFTSNIESAYGPGTDMAFLTTMRKSPGAKVIGQTIFGTA